MPTHSQDAACCMCGQESVDPHYVPTWLEDGAALWNRVVEAGLRCCSQCVNRMQLLTAGHAPPGLQYIVGLYRHTCQVIVFYPETAARVDGLEMLLALDSFYARKGAFEVIKSSPELLVARWQK